MIFGIQASAPGFERGVDREVEELATAIQAVFPMDTESAVLHWNVIPVLIGYKYDLSVMLDDLLPLLDDVLTSAHGVRSTSWDSNTFMATWEIEWSAERLRISARWEQVSGDYQDLLNRGGAIETGREQFLSEWKGPLQRIRQGIEESGIRVVDTGGNLARLRRIESAIPHFGRLYRQV